MFKLIRVDSASPTKVLLPVGSHIFGRGLFLDVDDKELKVSKTHGRFEVTKDGVSVVSMHVNPCFIQKVGSTHKIILNHNNCSALEHGDKVGLLPDSFWYELLYVPEDSSAVNSVNAEDINSEYEVNAEDIKSCNEDKEHRTRAEETNNAKDIAIQENENNQVPDSPSLLGTNSDEETTATAATSTISQQPLKRSHSLSEPDSDESHLKVTKTEPDMPSAISEEPGTSAQIVTTESSTKDASTSVDADSTSNMTPQVPNIGKERCIYGANCYRRNPQHKAQFAHPGEAAWGGGARGVCPWGAGCRRRDPRHWRDHDHPPGTQPPPPAPPQPHQPAYKKKTKRDRTRELSPVTFDNLPAKRARKAVSRASWTGSESDEDPFLTDDSDEWVPPSGSEQYTESQDYSQYD